MNFNAVAESQSELKFWSEAALCHFLEIPENLDVGHVIFRMVSFLGAFPFASQAPAILTYEAMLKAVTLFTGRYEKVLKRRRMDWTTEMYRSLAVYDNSVVPEASKAGNDTDVENGGMDEDAGRATRKGFAIDLPSADDDANGEDDDELVLAALESINAIDVMKHGELSTLQTSIIPHDNLKKLVELLLLIAPMQAQQHISDYSAQMTQKRQTRLKEVAGCVTSIFGEESGKGVTFKAFKRAIADEVPFLFDCLKPLFESFLFKKTVDPSKRKDAMSADGAARKSNATAVDETAASAQIKVPTPLLQEGENLDVPMLNQLSFFLKGDNLFNRLRLLYSGSSAGFSMGSFEKHVFHWQAPSILLVSGRLLSSDAKESTNIRERAFIDTLPSKRLPSSTELASHNTSSSNSNGTKRVVYGAYITAPWQATHKYPIGDASSLLFQLAPTHDLFRASSISTDYAYFNKPPTAAAPGLGFGTGITKTGSVLASSSSATTTSSLSSPSFSSHASHPPLHLGPVSLHVDDALEFAVFTHTGAGGGSFLPSRIPARKGADWQDRVQVESMEVWGCGGEEEARAQQKMWAWEEREAELRRKVSLGGTGDVEGDRELLKMAGVIGDVRI